MTKKIIIAFIFVFLICVTIYFFINYKVTITAAPELGTIKPPKISLMIMEGVSNEIILRKIDNNPSLIFEECEECQGPYTEDRTPLLTAIAYKRKTILKYLVRNGASVEKTFKLLKENNSCEEFSIYFRKCLDEMKKEG